MIASVLCDFNILYLINCKMLILFDILTSLKSRYILYFIFDVLFILGATLCSLCEAQGLPLWFSW